MDIREKKKIKTATLNFIKNLFEDKTKGDKVYTKLSNICGKTGQYGVPTELFQDRTNRKNRVLMPWKEVKNSNLTMKHLETFSGGVVVEFVNEDYFDPQNQSNPVFIALKNRIGVDENISSIITIRSESGSSSSAVQREYYARLMAGITVKYKGTDILVDRNNYEEFLISRTSSGGIGNERWTGFLYISVRGGQKETIEKHKNHHVPLFNPACEFATEQVLCDIDLVMLYFALHSVNKAGLGTIQSREQYDKIKENLEQALKESLYNSSAYKGNLYDYCVNHWCLTMKPGSLLDPIQALPIYIEDFSVDDKSDARNLDFTHDEAVKKRMYYWDENQKCVLTSARPTNVFWSKHLSNMLQQNMSLEEYDKFETENNIRRKEYLNKVERG